MTKILIVDIETTGLDKDKDSIIEFGSVLCDWEKKKPIHMISENIQYTEEIDPLITELTGIETYMVKAPYAVPLKTALFFFNKIAQEADYYCAHNSEFDFDFILPAAEKLGIKLPNKQIIDTRFDLPISFDQKSFKLNYLLADHGLFNPFTHRVIFNCLSVFKLMQEFPLKVILEYLSSEIIVVKANVGYQGREMARDMGFRWDAPTKRWLMEIKKVKYYKMKDKRAFPFPTQVEFEIPF